MKLVSTRNADLAVSFGNAVLDCIPLDGGLYVPAKEEDLRPWIMYMDESTSFASIAGTLTAALLKDEFSPVVTERIAATAFTGLSPELRQLDDNVWSLELYHGPTGCHKDFALLWFASALSHICTIQDRSATVLAATGGMTGRSMATAFAGKPRLKTILVYPKGAAAGLDAASLASNGGNIWPVEIEGTLQDAQRLVRDIYNDRRLVEERGLTLANTMNIGRLLPHVFSYMYAFTRLRKRVGGDIFYAVPSGNYGNLVAGLYSWKFSLPVNGFLTDATAALSCDMSGKCECRDSSIPLLSRGPADPASPSNLERLEQVFAVNPMMLRGFVFPVEVADSSIPELTRQAYKKYGVFLDPHAARAYGAVVAAGNRVYADEGTVVLVSKDHPAFEADTIAGYTGARPEVPDLFRGFNESVRALTRIGAERGALEALVKEITG